MKTAEAIAGSTTLFPHSIVELETYRGALLKRVTEKSNHKMGGGGHKVWRAGAFKGLPLYGLTLIERETCPSTCQAWKSCYGNNMPFAARIDPKQDEGLFLQRLLVELDKLDKRHPDGYSIRLHVLGDFYSVGYVNWWGRELEDRPLLHIYGYTHTIGDIRQAIDEVWTQHQARFNIFQSDSFDTIRPAAIRESIEGAETLPICPQQTDRVEGCLDCGLCTLPTLRGITFLEH